MNRRNFLASVAAAAAAISARFASATITDVTNYPEFTTNGEKWTLAFRRGWMFVLQNNMHSRISQTFTGASLVEAFEPTNIAATRLRAELIRDWDRMFLDLYGRRPIGRPR